MPAPRVVSGAPTVVLEWRLVRIVGTVVDVRKLGDRWRAELRVGSARVPVQGQAGARIPSTALVEGRRATIVGIVRRPYPGAADRRFAVVPRSPADIALGGAPGDGCRPAGAPPAGPAGEPGPVGADGSGSADGPSAAPSVELSSLAGHADDRVRVGGLVVELVADGFTLDDGSATARIVLTGDAAAYLGLIEPGDALEATGRVDAEAPDGPRLIVDHAADLVRVGDPGDPQATADPSPAEASGALGPGAGDPPGTIARSAALGGDFPDPTVAGAGWLAGVGVLSVVVTLVRRRRTRRAVAARIAARLARVAGPGAVP